MKFTFALKIAVFSVSNDLVTDQRLHKICVSLNKIGIHCELVGFAGKKTIPLINRPYFCKRFGLLFKRGPLFYAEINLRLFFYLLFKKVDILVANDLDVLLANYFVSVIKRKKLVYDSHEYFAQVPELVKRKFIQKIWLTIEKFILPKIKYSYTVCDSIAEIYSQKYCISMDVVRNVPILKPEVSTSKNEKFTIIYQGAVNIGRGIEKILEALPFLDDVKFWIVGGGYYLQTIKKLADELNVSDKIVFFGKLNFDELHAITSKTHLGISLEENLGLNYYYALPNKLFDYIHAGVPVLVSDLPEMRKIVEKYNIGFILKNREISNIVKIIENFKNNKNLQQLNSENCKFASSELNWDIEEQKLFGVYNKVLNHKN